AENVLTLVRPGVTGDVYPSVAELRIAKTTTGIQASTRLDFRLLDTGASTFGTPLSLLSNGNVGIGTTEPEGKFHVLGGTAGTVTAHGNANLGVFEGNGSNGISILVPNGSLSKIQFGSPADNIGGLIQYQQSTKTMRIGAGSDTAGGITQLIYDQGQVGFTLSAAGNVGIGTTDPAGYKLNISAADYTHLKLSSGIPLVKFAGSTFNSGNGAELWQGGDGTFRLNITSSQGGITISPTGQLTFPGYGAGDLVTDSSGNVTASSDERLKNIEGDYTRGLADIANINPISYYWKDSSGYDTNNLYSGFSAQNVRSAIPEAVGMDPRGFLSLTDRPILAATVNAVKELNVRTLSLAPAAQNQAAHSLAVSSDASVAGKLTVTGIGTFSNSLTAASVFTQVSVTAVAFLTNSAVTLPSEVLTNGSADLFKKASYAKTSMQALSERTDLLAVRIDEVETRLALLEASSATEQVSGAVGLTLATLKSMLQTLGIYLENGIAQFETLVFRQLAVAKDTNGDSSAGSQTILAGNTVVEVQNPYVLPTSKIFVTFTGPIQGAWYLSNKEAGKFRVTLAQGQSADVSFDYFILQTEGQLASPGAAGQTQTQSEPTPSPSTEPLPPVFPGEGTSTTTPVVSSGDTTPPSITLNGPAAREIDQGATWIDLGATASDETDGDLTASIQVQGTVDTSTPGTYTVTYSVSDAAGNQAHVSRIVSVKAVAAPAPEPTSTPEPAPAP
ncbi:MAG: DUF5011 domain-containing protein, partial [bacterium]|nr:DUF5011 domain-containing protein [bacterium]